MSDGQSQTGSQEKKARTKRHGKESGEGGQDQDTLSDNGREDSTVENAKSRQRSLMGQSGLKHRGQIIISGSGGGPSYVGPGDMHPNSARVSGEHVQRAPPMRYDLGDTQDLGVKGTDTDESTETSALTEIEEAGGTSTDTGASNKTGGATGATTEKVPALDEGGAPAESARRRANAT